MTLDKLTIVLRCFVFLLLKSVESSPVSTVQT